MGQDYISKKRSDEEIRKIARETLLYYRERVSLPVNIVDILNSATVPTVEGVKELQYKIVPDYELNDYAITEFSDYKRIVTVKQSVHDAAFYGDGRDRMTLAHELGHAVLHSGAPKARSAVQIKTNFIKAYESSERQAYIFASSFLIDDVLASQFKRIEDISVHFGVSWEAARICFERLHAEELHEKIYRGMKQLSERLLAPNKPEIPTNNYIDTSCPKCSCPTMIKIGVKFYCATCHNTCDPFQDGDPYP